MSTIVTGFTPMIDPQRIEALNDDPVTPGRYVLYWMQASQREKLNHALEYAIGQANQRRLPLRRTPLRADSLDMRLGGLDLRDVDGLLGRLRIGRSVKRVPSFRGGAREAERRLRAFIANKLDEYHLRRNEPAAGIQSDMSPYLHFGQVSPVAIALKIRRCGAPQEAKDAYLEELIVQRELSINFVTFNSKYDSYGHAIPPWARATLSYHSRDKRQPAYSLAQLEAGDTDDPYWNAAQREMILTGKMHNYMRMYWGKKILQWHRRPAEAFRAALHLNNKYELDGRDPNSYAGVAWCFGKHDRPWAEREIFGKVRYMNAAGLERKFDMDAYLRKVDPAR